MKLTKKMAEEYQRLKEDAAWESLQISKRKEEERKTREELDRIGKQRYEDALINGTPLTVSDW